MSVASRTREAVDNRPFLREALRVGVLNYTATARYLDVGDPEAVAAALRRYADELGDAPSVGTARVTMQTGLGQTQNDDAGEAILAVGEQAFVPDSGSLTALIAHGDPTPAGLAQILGRCDATGITVVSAAIADSLVLVVNRRDGPQALRIVESAFA